MFQMIQFADDYRMQMLGTIERLDDYRESILPAACRKRVAIEAGVSDLWHKYVGLDGKIVGIDRFGLSADGGIVLKELGISAEGVIAAAQAL